MLVAAICITACFLTGCGGPLYGNVKQYQRGSWYGFADHHEVARIDQDKLAMKKLEASAPLTASENGTSLGYKGVVANFSSYRATIDLIGPESRNFLLEPGQQVETYLIPGKYLTMAQTSSGGYRSKNVGGFTVGVKKHSFQGRDVHWFAIYDN